MATQFMYTPSQNYASHGYDYSSHSNKNGGGFAFRKRLERVDWRKIASVDVDHISRTLDFNALQENVMNITFCNIETELDVRMVDPNFLKLFKLAQLTIEYLLHSQDYLAGLVASNEEKAKKEKEDHNELQKQIEKLTQELSEVKKESHKRKKLLIAQQQMMHAGSGSYNKCPFCTKAFLNNSFLQSHITRRHGSVGVSKSSSPTQGGSINQTLETELQHIKERLKMTESQLQDERKMLESLKHRENKTSSVVTAHMEAYREAEAGDKEEIERVKEMFMRELQEVNQKYMAAERAVVEMENRSGLKRSNLGELEDDVEHEKSFLQRQREEVAVLKEELQHQVGTVESRLRHELERQEGKWQKKVHKMTKQHAQEIKNLNDALESTTRETGRRATTPEARQQQQKVENILRKSREQEKLLNSQEEMLKREVERAAVAASPVTHLSVPKSPRPPRASSPGRMMSMVPSDEDDESTMFGSGSMNNTGRRSLKSTMATTGSLGDPTLGTTQFLEQLRKNPTLKIMHQEFADLLEEQVAKNGIPKGSRGIDTQMLEHKLAMMKTRRQTYVKKFTDFETLRLHYDRIAELKAREKVKAMKNSPRTNSRSLHSSLPSPQNRGPQQVRSPHHTSGSSPSPQARSPQTQGRARSPQPHTQGRAASPGVPRPAPRSATPQRTMQSTGSTTEWTSTQWDSDEESEEGELNSRVGSGQPMIVTPSKSNRSNFSTQQTKTGAPSPRPRGQPTVIQSKPISTVDDDDWDDSESEDNAKPAPKPVQPRVIMSQPKGQKVSELSRTIESQLSGRKKTDKPFGGVDTMEKKKSNTDDILQDLDDDSDWDVTPAEDDDPPKALKRPPTRNSNRGSHAETDFSTNTYGTSVWGSSSKGASTANPGNRASTSKSSFITDISSDEDLDVENI